MAKQEIREFGDFMGENNQGYVIVGGKTSDIEGGKKLLSDIIPVVPEQVNADWNAESGKAKILNVPDVLKEIPEPNYSSGGTVLSVKSGELRWDWPEIKMAEYVDKVTIDTDANGTLCVLNPIPDDGEDGDVLTLEYGEPTWKELEIPAQAQADWDEKDDSEPSFIANKPFDEVNGSGGLDIIQGSLVVQIDKKTIKRTDGGTLYVANPVPEPLSDHSDRGKVLTVQQASDPNNPDEIVWNVPQGGTSLPDTPSDYASKNYVLGFNKSTGELAWHQISNGSGGALPYV